MELSFNGTIVVGIGAKQVVAVDLGNAKMQDEHQVVDVRSPAKETSRRFKVTVPRMYVDAEQRLAFIRNPSEVIKTWCGT